MNMNATTEQEQIPTYPAMKGLGDLASMRPVIVVDSREQCPLVFSRLQAIRGSLQTGDYSFAGGEETFAVERKSVPDLVGCCVGENRERFERELHRLRGFNFARLLIVGSKDEIRAGLYRSKISPTAVLHSLAAWEARFIPVVYEPDPAEAARLVETFAYWAARELCEQANNLLRAGRLHERTGTENE